MERMTVDECVELAWGLGRFWGDPRPGPAEALAAIERDLRTCGFNWLTGQEARDVLREHLGLPTY